MDASTQNPSRKSIRFTTSVVNGSKDPCLHLPEGMDVAVFTRIFDQWLPGAVAEDMRR